MPPPPPPKRIKRPAKVLGEDDYADALSHIIARDFFPGLLETESKQQYLDALDSQDQGWIAAAGQKLADVITPGPDGRRARGKRGTSMATPIDSRVQNTPTVWNGDTPRSEVSSAVTEAGSTIEKSEVDTNMSLSAFQQKYTSEDNESFYKLLDKQNQKKSERYAWMWAGNKIPAARQIAHRKRERLLTDAKSAEEAENGKALVQTEAPDTRKAMPDTWRCRPNNPLMFAPSSVEDQTQTVAQKNEELSAAPPKAVVYDNTRIFQTSLSQTSNPPPSPSLSAVKDAIGGRPRPTASEASFNAASTPKVNGYAFVDSEEPDLSPPPSTASDPLLLGGGDSTPNPFKLKESSKREALHHRMVERVAKGKRTAAHGKREAELKTPATPKFLSSPRVEKRGGLTPAAERLLGKVGGGLGKTPAVGTWDGKGRTPRRSGLREMLTPKMEK